MTDLIMKLSRLLLLALTLVQATVAATLTGGYTVGSGLLGNNLVVDNAAIGGGDSSSATGDLGWTAELAGLWSSNSTVILTGLALPIWSDSSTNNTTVSGTLTFYFYDLNQGANPGAFDGAGVETLVGTATASFTQGAIGTYYVTFDTPVSFTAKSTGLAVRIVNSGWMRLKINTAALAPGVVLKNSSTGAAIGGTYPNFRMTLAGLAFLPPAYPPRVNLAKYQPVLTDSTSGQRLASYVTDGVVGNDNRWQSDNSGPHWAQVSFPFPVPVGSAQVFSGIDDAGAMTDFALQYWTNSSWVTIPGGTVSGNTLVATNVVFAAPVTATAFRIYDSADKTVNLKELALYPPNGANGFAIGTDVTLDLARKRPALAASSTAGHFAQNAVDGYVDDSAMWQTALAGSNALMIDLRVNSKIGSAHLYSGSASAPPLANFVLQYRNGSTWQNIPGGSVSGNTNPVCVVSFSAGVTTSNMLLVFTNTLMTSIKELCIFAANNNNGFAPGTDVVFGPPSTAQFDDYNDAFYNINNQAANRAMAVSGGVPGLFQPGLTNAPSEYQILLNISSGTYRLRNRATGNCLSGAQLSTNAGALLVDEPYSALPDQDWILQPVDGTHFLFVNQWSGLAVDTQGGGTVLGTPLVQNPITGSASQNWAFGYAEHYPKKGMDGGSWVASPSTLNGNWCYDWGRDNPNAASLPADVVYDPMQWGNFNWDIGSNQGPIWQLYPKWRTQAKALHCLGFNEPDNASQSNISSNDAVALWPRIQAMDVPLVSPAPANLSNGWLAYFYDQATNLGYRVDYTAVHNYPSPNGGSSDNLVSFLQTAHDNWGRPVWLTEFSFVDWNGGATWTEEDNYNCLAEFLWRAESLPWLRHYGMFLFTADTNNPIAPNPWTATTPAPRSNAFDTNGNLTPFGQLYAVWDGDANVESNKAYFIHNNGTRKRLENTLGASVSATDIRVSDDTVQWTLSPAGSGGWYYIISQRDGRRLSYVNGGSVTLAAPGTTGGAVQWGLTQYQYGWFYLEHPATGKRLKLQYNNSTLAATYSLVTNTTTGTALLWRFIVPLNPIPPAPFGVIAVGGTNQVALNWNYGSATGVTYNVYRGTNSGGGYSLIVSNLTATSYLDTDVLAGTTYYYVVAAEDASANESPYSNEVAAAPMAPLLTTPTNLTFTVSNNILVLSWPSNYIGWWLQVQTNSLDAGLGTNWVAIPESETNSVFQTPVNPAVPAMFYRLKLP
jgi:hypothetical protein